MLLALFVASSLACADIFASCHKWAAHGGCAKYASFMELQCPRACGKCDDGASQIDPCKPEADAFGPGAIRAAFEAALDHEELSPSVLSEDPFVVQFDTFLTADEAGIVADTASKVGFDSSACAYRDGCEGSQMMSCVPVAMGDCWEHTVMRRFEAKMLKVAGAKAENCEAMSFLRYEKGQAFVEHHDQNAKIGLGKAGGPRVWTLYAFLSEPSAGGEFKMPKLGLSVQPKLGRAIMWPHVRDDDLVTPDLRTMHEGAAVEGGIKMGGNLHVHRGNLRTQVLAGCPALDPGIKHVFNYDPSNYPGATPLHDVVGFHGQGGAAPARGRRTDQCDDREWHLGAHCRRRRGQRPSDEATARVGRCDGHGKWRRWHRVAHGGEV